VAAPSAEKKRKTKVSASQKVEQHIRNAIYAGALKPRERVIEEDIAQRMKCSRGPVREALLRLERDGLIVTFPRRGSFIRDISADSIDVTFRIRAKLEGLCVRYMREDMTDKDQAALTQCLKEMRAAALKRDDEEFLQADMKLHQTIWRLSKRDQLFITLNTVMNPSIFMVARAYSSQTPVMDRYKDHERYVKMIVTAPLDEVEDRVEAYFHNLYNNLFSQNTYLLGMTGKTWAMEAPVV
jgi:DNA-binding GntR family transcriptional regulator